MKAITLASIFMPPELSPFSAAVLLAVTGSLVGFPCSMMWALFGMSIRNLLKDPLKQRLFNLCMGAILVILAFRFLC